MAETVHSDWRGLLSFANTVGQSDYNTQNGYTITSTNTVGANVQFSQNAGNGGFVFNYNANNGVKDVPFQLYEDVTSNTAVTLFITGSNVYSSNTSVAPLTSTGLTVGGRGGIPNTGALVIAEVLLYSNVLTTSQRQQVEGYLAHKWGLTGYYDSSIPLSIPGCQLWLDGADPLATGTTPADGATVSTWVDKSGNGYNATAAPSRTAGTYSTSFRAVNFPNSTTGYITNYSAAPTNETMFVVFNNPSPSSGNNILIGGVSGARSLGAGYTNAGTGTVGNLNTQVAWLASTGTYTAGTTVFTTSQFTPSSNSISLNGGTFSTGGAPGFTAGRVTYLGVDATNSFYHYVGYAMEILFYNSVLTTTQRQTIETYLAKKWGLTTLYPSIPSTHPFSSVRPHLRPFQLIDVPGCQLWLDAADSSTVTGTTTVTQWRDKSGNARHLGVGSGTTSYSSNAIVLNSSYMFVNSPVNLTNVTVFIVSKSTGVTNQTILGAKPNTDYVYNSVDGFGFYNDPPTGRIRFYGQGNDPNQSIFFTDTSITKLYTFQSTGTTVSGWLNGTSQSGGTLTTTRTSTAQGFAIGGEWGGSSYVNIWVTASIYEILVYNTALTTSERQQVEGYLAHKWGLTGYYAPTTPLSIPGCALWLDAADPAGTGVRPANGTNLTTWKDKSISNFPITSAGSSYNTTAVNGLPGINISTNPFGYNPGSAQNNWQEVFAVALWTGGSTFNNYNGLITSSVDTFGSDGIIFIGDTNTTNWYPIGNTYTTPIINGTQTYTAIPTIQSPFIVRTFSTTAVNLRGVRIGLDRSFEGRNWQGFISEVIMYNTALTTTQRQTIEAYLAKKWGIGASSIPSTHPFKSIPPASLHTILVVSATGGTIVTNGSTKFHIFTSSGSLVVTGGGPINYLLVGGGGGGGDRHGGGGGAGGVLSGSWTATAGTYTVTVGLGGEGGSYQQRTGGQNPQGAGFKGGDSSLSGTGVSQTAYGGGGGGTLGGNPGGTVGSGGGGGGGASAAGSAGTSGQGNSGGAGSSSTTAGGGGGGAGGAGVAAEVGTGGVGTSTYSNQLLAAGYGTTFAVATSPNTVISGGVAYIAGGGGGCPGNGPGPGGAGGLGGGGRGDWNVAYISTGTPNTGGGGGASRSLDEPSDGVAGGSGLVLLWY
jgi:hypothetical protein